MKLYVWAFLQILVCVILFSQIASAAVIDFEGFPDSTILTNQYPGLTFSNTIILTAGISLNELEFPPHSGVNVASDNGGPITISFSSPLSRFSGFFTYSQPITIQAFGAANNFLGLISSNPACVSNEALSGTPGCPPNELLTVMNLGAISRVVITGDPAGGSFTLDDATYIPAAVPPTITKTFGAPSIDINGSTALTFTITNPNAVALTGVSFSDTLPDLIVSTPNGLTPPTGCNGTIPTATAGSNGVSLAGATLPAGGSCTFSVNVTGTSAGLKTNTTSAVTSTNGGTGLSATATITVLPVFAPLGEYQLRYLANLNQGDSYVNLTNAGTLNGLDPTGRICVNVYTFDPAEELISCCACPVTPNGLNSLSARNDLISNTLTPGVPTAITVKLVATVPNAGGSCNASSPNAANQVRGMRAWATTLHLNTSKPAPGVYQHTETPFSNAELSVSELAKLTGFCAFIQANGSGFGICKSCRSGGLGAVEK